MNKRLEKKMQKKVHTDALMGAPGHTTTDVMPTKREVSSAGSVGNMGFDQQETATGEETSSIDAILSPLGSVFGEENIGKLKTLISENSRNAEEKIMQFVRSVTPDTENFKMPKLSDAQKYPLISASAVAAGVGTIFLLREYLKSSSPIAKAKPKDSTKSKKTAIMKAKSPLKQETAKKKAATPIKSKKTSPKKRK